MKNQEVPVFEDVSRPRTLCEHASCPKLNGVEVPFSFTGDSMGDGNVEINVRLLAYSQKLFAIPFTQIQRSEVKATTDSAQSHYSEGEWIQEESVTKKTHFERCFHVFCEAHLPEARQYLHRFHLTKNRNSLGKRIIPLKHFEKAYGEATEEILSIKTELVPMSDPVLLFDPSWILTS